jgi:hypothetical protein
MQNTSTEVNTSTSTSDVAQVIAKKSDATMFVSASTGKFYNKV